MAPALEQKPSTKPNSMKIPIQFSQHRFTVQVRAHLRQAGAEHPDHWPATSRERDVRDFRRIARALRHLGAAILNS
jgi:hypothetical protein